MGVLSRLGTWKPTPKAVGHRLRHDHLRSVVYTVPLRHRRYPKPRHCPSCQQVHRHKTYHLSLDADGTVIVSETILENLREAGMPGLSYVNEVTAPPAQRVGIGGPGESNGGPQKPIVVHR